MPRLGLGLGLAKGSVLYSFSIISNFISRVTADSGTFEAQTCLQNYLNSLGQSLYNSASLIITPNAYKASKIYALKPTNGSGDLTFARASSRTRRNSSGIIESLANNVPALEYPDSGCPAWLFEPQRTNTALWSQDFTDAGWDGYNASAVSNTHTAPDGTLTADTISFTVDGGFFRRLGGISIADNTTYTLSCYFRNIGLTAGQTFRMYLSSPSAAIYATIDLAALTAVPVVSGISSGASASITQISTEWSRVTLTFTAGAAAPYCYIGFEAVFTPRSFVAWGIQLEVGAFASSYIATTGTAVTRVADTFSLSNVYTNGLISASGGTWYIHFINNTSIVPDNTAGLFLGTNSASGFLGDSFNFIAAGPSGRHKLWKYESGVGTSLFDTTTDTVKIAIKWNGSTADVFVNGVKEVSATSFTQVALQNLGITSLGRIFNIPQMMLFPTPLSDAELQSLTTL